MKALFRYRGKITCSISLKIDSTFALPYRKHMFQNFLAATFNIAYVDIV